MVFIINSQKFKLYDFFVHLITFKKRGGGQIVTPLTNFYKIVLEKLFDFVGWFILKHPQNRTLGCRLKKIFSDTKKPSWRMALCLQLVTICHRFNLVNISSREETVGLIFYF